MMTYQKIKNVLIHLAMLNVMVWSGGGSGQNNNDVDDDSW